MFTVKLLWGGWSMDSHLLHADITHAVLGAAFEVHGILGPGFLEKLYENALAKEFERRRIPFQQQVEVPILYKGDEVGTHKLDLLVANTVVVELKAVRAFEDIHKQIAVAYLKATNLSVALLLNFATQSLQYKRIIR